MSTLLVGVCQVSMLFRHARSLRDKRSVMRSLSQKLRNQGFSVSECAAADDPRHGVLGFTYAGSSPGAVQHAMDAAMRLFLGDFEVLSAERDLFDYSETESEDLVSPEEDKYLGDQ